MGRFASVDYRMPGATFAAWEGCPSCSGGPAPGARAWMAHWLEQAAPLARSLGIYACRDVRGSSSLSIHACGGAIDGGVPVTAEGHEVAMAYLRRVAPVARSLGIQLVIFSRTYGSARNRWPTPYRGVHPHDDHFHGELNRRARQELTLSTLRARVGDWRQEADVLKRGDRGGRVEYVQRRLNDVRDKVSQPFDRLDPDGAYGPATEAAVRAVQHNYGLRGAEITGVLDAVTLAYLGALSHAATAEHGTAALNVSGLVKVGDRVRIVRDG